ncbi:hypothetical protein ABVK25_010958 [Lepraria finkii]|uniref:Uncharacterized protein n=1 Tax=Lepraria finkii TaxID=1340010 RepID=A0ABR4AT71_9LECA
MLPCTQPNNIAGLPRSQYLGRILLLLLSTKFNMLILCVVLYLGTTVLAKRPQNASICDYYAQSLYGTNTSQTQYQLTQHIVTLAFAGAPPGSSNISSSITGIFNPGTFSYQGTTLGVDLLPWFNGSIDSTNLNNQAVGIDWLDGGGLDPLYAFLNGSTDTVMLTNTTNQYRLFTHFYEAFAHVFDCSDPATPPPSPSSAPPPSNLAYVPKFMNLNNTDLGHFIDQMTQAAEQYGFSTEDANTINTHLNSIYNVACAPPVTQNPMKGPQLLSLCQASNCPLALDPDCAAYVNLSASGIPSAASSVGPSAMPTHFIPTVISQSTTAPTSSTSAGSSGALGGTSTSSSPALSPGAIAGIAIGGAAVILAFIIALVFIMRRRRPIRMEAPPPSMYGTGSGFASPPGEQKYLPSFTSSPMQSPGRYGQFGEGHPQAMQQVAGHDAGRPPVEMDSTRGADGQGMGQDGGRSWLS